MGNTNCLLLVLLCIENWLRYEIARKMPTWSSMAFFFAVAVNILVAFFYPYKSYYGALGEWDHMTVM